jgi:hypothetical protein
MKELAATIEAEWQSFELTAGVGHMPPLVREKLEMVFWSGALATLRAISVGARPSDLGREILRYGRVHDLVGSVH